MTLSWNEIKDRALQFSKEWANTTNEEAEHPGGPYFEYNIGYTFYIIQNYCDAIDKE
jgi:hypothetical protein